MIGNLDERSNEMKEKFYDNWEGETPLQSYFERKIQTFTLTQEDFKRWSGSIVYICWKLSDIEITSLGDLNRKNKKCRLALYVGRSSCGISRPTGRGHHKKNVIEIADELEILPCYNDEDSIKLEKELILYLRPSGNCRQETKPRIIHEIEKYHKHTWRYNDRKIVKKENQKIVRS